ncbi:MAG TPA: SGNH/GDSL hydrolase family protein [Luteimonas sp.]|nr:SGNH/GDSL hydrolase family protein [Luteimonas sp.]
MRLVGLFMFLAISALGTLPGCTGLRGAAADPGPAARPSAGWQAEMAGFAAADRAAPPAADAVVFTGSSSVRMWDSLAHDFPGVPVINRGFGGSQVRDATWHADALVVRYRPRRILLYAGDNDIDAGRTPAQVLHDVQAFVARIRRDLPRVPIVYVAIKPSPARLHQLPMQRQANAAIRRWAPTVPMVAFADVATPMLDARGQPRAELFLADRLHMNASGYAVWQAALLPYVR